MTTAVSSRVSPFDGIGTAAAKDDGSLEALRRARLDFDVDLVPVPNPVTGEMVIGGLDENGQPTSKYYASVRTDTKQVLGIVEGRYNVIPNRDLFSIGDAMAEDDGAIISRASCLNDGSRCFLHINWPEDRAINVVGDIVGRRAIMQNAHDGKYAALIRLMALRLVCANGMVVPVPQFSFEFRIKHTESANERIAEAHRIMSAASGYFDTFGKLAEKMARTQVTAAHASLLTKRLPHLDKDTEAAKKKRKAIIDLFNGGQANGGHEAVKETAWGFLNAVGELVDHSGRVRKTYGNDESVQRFKNVLEGSGHRMKLAAFQILLADKSLGLGEFHRSLKASRN